MSGVYKLSKYIKKFYELLNDNKISEAENLKNEICKILNNTNSSLELEELQEDLHTQVSYNKRIKVNNDMMEYICDFYKSVVLKDEEKIKHNYQSIMKLLNKDNYYVSNEEFINRLTKDIKKAKLKNKLRSKILKTYENGLAIVESITEEETYLLNEIIKEIKNVTVNIINKNGKDIIILRNKNDVKNKNNTLKLYQEAMSLYKERKYKEALEKFNDILLNSNPKANIYGKIGICYMKLKEKNKAILYFKVATYLNSENNPKYDYSDLIISLENNEKINKFHMKEKDFSLEFDYYGIENINDIIELTKSGYNIEQACSYYNLTGEEICLVYLIFAKQCYEILDYKNGDLYLKRAEQKEYKTARVLKELEQIRKNKKFYKNRKHDKSLMRKKDKTLN